MLRSRRTLALLTFVGLGVGSLVSVATPASAGPLNHPETLTFLHTRVVKVTTSRHVHLHLSMVVERAASRPGRSNANSKSTLAVTLSKGTESHTWNFHLARGAFSDNGDIGRGRVSTGRQLAPYGSLAVKFSALSPRTVVVCDPHNAKINYRVKIHGRLKLKTHSSWGTFSGRIATRHGLLQAGHGPDVEEACARIPCRGGVSWTVTQGLTTFDGITTRRGGKIIATRLSRLSRPRHASRLDIVTVTTTRPQLTGGDLPSLSVNPSAHAVTGSAELTATSAGVGYRQDCAGGQMAGSQWTATFTQGTPALTFHERVFGPLTVASRTNQQLLSLHVTR